MVSHFLMMIKLMIMKQVICWIFIFYFANLMSLSSQMKANEFIYNPKIRNSVMAVKWLTKTFQVPFDKNSWWWCWCKKDKCAFKTWLFRDKTGHSDNPDMSICDSYGTSLLSFHFDLYLVLDFPNEGNKCHWQSKDQKPSDGSEMVQLKCIIFIGHFRTFIGFYETQIIAAKHR